MSMTSFMGTNKQRVKKKAASNPIYIILPLKFQLFYQVL